MAIRHICLASVLLLSVCLAVSEDQKKSESTETAKEALDEAAFQANMGIADCDAGETSRTKRSTFLPNVGSVGYNPWLYLPLPDFTLYPGLIRTSAFNLPSQRFFTSFSAPAQIVRTTEGAISRYYYKTGTYENAYNDFMALPLINRKLVSQAQANIVQTAETSVIQPIVYQAVSRSFPSYTFELCNSCCQNYNPCITSYLSSDLFPGRRVSRYYVYLA